MKGRIVNYRRSVHRTKGNQVIVQATGISSKEEAAKLVGKKVTWNTGKRPLEGEIAAAHGNSGALRARFSTGLPGQCIGKEVTIQT